jgi:hypothetical protein
VEWGHGQLGYFILLNSNSMLLLWLFLSVVDPNSFFRIHKLFFSDLDSDTDSDS